MQVYLDDQPITPANAAEATLGEVIDTARIEAAKNDRVIVGVLCDGADITRDDFDARLSEPADTYARVDLTSGRAEQLVADALNQALEILEETDQRRQEIVEWLTAGEARKAQDGLMECFQGWSQIHQAIAQSLAFLNINENELLVEGTPLPEVLGGIIRQLQQVKEVLEVGDDVLLSDLLQYEFDDAIDKWGGAIRAVLARTPDPPTG